MIEIPEPIALEDGEPQQTDLDDEDCCWWWDAVEQFWIKWCGDAGGIAGIRRYNETDYYLHKYTHWLPHWAIKTPEVKDETDET